MLLRSLFPRSPVRCWTPTTSRLYSTRSSPAPSPRLISTGRTSYRVVGGLAFCALGFYFFQIEIWSQTPIRPNHFSETTLLSSEETSSTTKLLRLLLSPVVARGLSDLPSIWSVYVKDADIQVERPYTPLEGLTESNTLSFWVRKYPHGEVGRWLHAKRPNDKIEIRGPERTWTWRDGEWNSVIMISGGTGIAPFYQLLYSHFNKVKEGPSPKFVLLHAHRSYDELPPAHILQNLATWENGNPQSLSVRSFIDNANGVVSNDGLTIGKISKKDIAAAIEQCSGKTVVLICGPEGMIAAIAGPKGRNQVQGDVGGILGQLGNRCFDVWKL